VRDSTTQDELTSVLTSNSGVELMVTPSRAGGVPFSFVICGPQPQNEKGKGKAAER
jgi:hypothetical protein